ncbi:MAG: hypothetical protein MRY63_11140 [Neomegalonema sp.]|nr:hypothetical protein [Neomegalonema sp.]
MPEVFEISADKLAGLYPDLHCDACGGALRADPAALWVKSGCGYFCPSCVAKGIHLTHPACALRRG